MKEKLYFIASICLLLIPLAVSGQVNPVTKAEYDESLKAAEKKTAAAARTETYVSETYRNGRVENTTKTVYEWLSDQRYKRTSYTLKDGSLRKSYELIRYDGRTFERTDEGEWLEIVRTGSDSGSSFDGGSGTEPVKVEQYAAGTSKLDGRTMRFLLYYRVYQLEKFLNFSDQRCWIDDEGRIVRRENKVSNLLPTNIFNKSEWTYNYDLRKLSTEIPQNARVVEK